jgi:mannose-6-phosphate isomerase
VGTKSSQSNQFPLLFKIIDAKNKLSVQVHPNNGNAALTGGQPKTEMWYVLDCVPGASLYAGLAADATATSVAAASRAGSVADQLVELSVQPGQALFIPGGLVHAIGDGCLIYEVQQNSNTTYRMFDWNRTDGAGKPRELHIEASLTSIDWTLKPPAMVTPSIAEHSTDASWSNVVSCEFFTMKKLDLTGTAEIKQDGSTFTALFAVSGSVLIRCDEGRFELAKGSSALLPAAPGSYSIDAITPAALLITTL